MAMIVRPVTREATKPFLLGIHYAKRMPSISKAFGLYDGADLEGVVCYGKPPSAPLRSGICGKEYSEFVWELNRLCLKRNEKNAASFLVSKSIKMMREDAVIISFADCSQGHVGTVYQACSFLYCGLSAKRTDWTIRGKEHLHGQTVADEFRGRKDRAAAMREKYGDDFYLRPRPRKHRYVKIIGRKGFRAQATKALRYQPQDYSEAAKAMADQT